MVSPAAILHGANDAWVCFTRRNAWSQEGDEWRFDTPEESWDLIKVFYPDSLLDAIYRHPCPEEPQGYYTRTPYGTVDILPVEASGEIYKAYSHMAFLGYNTADGEQVDKLCDYVKNGGKLLLGWCHLFTDTDRQTAIRGSAHVIDAAELTGVILHGFSPEKDGVSVGDITVTGGDVTVEEEKDGRPLVINNMDFDSVVTSVEQGTCDIGMAGLTITPSRQEQVTFADPYYDASQVVVARADDTTFDGCKSAEDVAAILESFGADIQIGYQNGTTGGFYINGDADWGFDGLTATGKAYRNGSLAIQDMINGNIDYVIIDEAPANRIVDSMNALA